MINDTKILNDRLVFFLGVNTGYVTDGLPDDRYVDFYRRRSSSKVYCSIIGNVVIPGGHRSNSSTPTITLDRVWTTVSHAIREAGSRAGIQLATAWDGYRGERNFRSAAGHQVIEQARHLVSSLGIDFINDIMNSFDSAASIAVDHGFGHIQIHAAHGYLPNLLIDDRLNPNASYIRNRLSRLAETMRSNGVETSIRISLKAGDAAFDAVGGDSFIDAIALMPFDFIDLSSGFYNIDKRLIYPSLPQTLSDRHLESLAVAHRHSKKPVIISGRVGTINASLPPNVHLGFCRDLIANPSFLSQTSEGCRKYNKCHYYSRGEESLSCSRWPG